MSIWFDTDLSISWINGIFKNTMADYLGMECTEIGEDYLLMKMPVNNNSRQPYGILHGGASCALAETIGSVASNFVIDRKLNYCVGLEINANHIRSVMEGEVIARCSPVHLGRSTHVWDIRIKDQKDKLVCISRLTVAILPINKRP